MLRLLLRLHLSFAGALGPPAGIMVPPGPPPPQYILQHAANTAPAGLQQQTVTDNTTAPDAKRMRTDYAQAGMRPPPAQVRLNNSLPPRTFLPQSTTPSSLFLFARSHFRRSL